MANSKSYVKKVLVDEAELDRLQQRQIREYFPELASLARFKSNTDSILRRSNLSPQEKLNRLAALQGRLEQKKQKRCGCTHLLLRCRRNAYGGASIKNKCGRRWQRR